MNSCIHIQALHITVHTLVSSYEVEWEILVESCKQYFLYHIITLSKKGYLHFWRPSWYNGCHFEISHQIITFCSIFCISFLYFLYLFMFFFQFHVNYVTSQEWNMIQDGREIQNGCQIQDGCHEFTSEIILCSIFHVCLF